VRDLSRRWPRTTNARRDRQHRTANEFYVGALGFKFEERHGRAIVTLSCGDLTFWVAAPMASASSPMPDGRRPKSGGWNRFVVVTENRDSLVAKVRERDVHFRNEPFSGPGGRQVLI